MAQPTMSPPLGMAGEGVEDGNDDPGWEKAQQKYKKGGRYSFGTVCPHKAFPPRMVDRKLLKTQKDYVNFLMKKPLQAYPWYEPAPPKIVPKKFKKPAPSYSPPPNKHSALLQIMKRLPLTGEPPEKLEDEDLDLDRYIVLEKEKVKKKKKKKPPKISTVDYEIKVTTELEFLLGVMADAKEVLVQKAVDYERERIEAEEKGQREGDIIVLQSIVQGMMFKIMTEHEEDIKRRELEEQEGCFKSHSKKSKRNKKKRGKICKAGDMIDEFDEDLENERQQCLQKQKMKEQTTKQLVSFLKDMFDDQLRKKQVVVEEKAVSPYESEQEIATTIYQSVIEEVAEEEAEEEEIDEEEELEGEGTSKDNEGFVDMDEVKKKLEDIQPEEGVEEVEAEPEVEEEDNEWLSEIESEMSGPEMQDASAQFNYFLERKAIMGKTPRNITDDLTQFMRIVIMGDNNLREILKEKELVEFKRKQLDFMTMGMLIRQPTHCQCRKKQKKGAKGKCKCKCCTKKKGRRGKSMECKEDPDMTYNFRPTEFMLMLQVLNNALQEIHEQDLLLKKPSGEISVSVSVDESILLPPMPENEEEEEEEESSKSDDDEDDL